MSTMTITVGPCFHCKETTNLEVDAASYNKWKAGTFIQNAFPDLSLDEREMIQTGIHPECWDIAFPKSEEEDF